MFEKSILEFEKVFKFSESNKLDDAQFKIILCHLNLNNYDLALEQLVLLEKNFSSSEYIDKAKIIINTSF